MRVKGNQILDDSDRVLLLRGCNLGGSSKIPSAPPEAAGQGKLSLKNPAEVSFVGRPFPLEEAEEHFERLGRWGFTFIRLVITWEALEHSGPGIYDEAYLAYLRKLLVIAERRSISVFLDPHQDVWSRWTGGDGAPAWTLEKIGIDLEKIDAVGAAVTQQRFRELEECRAYWGKGGAAPFFWPVNYSRYGAATMFTLFFGGNTYAPNFKIEGEPAQDWLQEKYIAAFRHCYRRLKNCRAIAGWGAMNEPHPGLIGCRDLDSFENYALALGPMPSHFQAMTAAGGRAVKAGVYTPGLNGPRRTGFAVINPAGAKLFRDGYSCPWKEAGIWADKDGGPELIKKDHFALYKGRPAQFTEDFLKPFLKRFAERMREADRPGLFFIEGTPRGAHPQWRASDGEDVVNAFHHYDGITLFRKSFNPRFTADLAARRLVLGRKKVAEFWAGELAAAVKWSREKMEGMPCLLGEFGLPFDLDKKRAYQTGDYRRHEEALSLYYDGVDRNLLHATIWNYTADNSRREGDKWNGEDLSIYCEGEGRALKGWLRPYPAATAGEPLCFSWDRKKRIFTFRFRADSSVTAPTEIFCPTEIFRRAPEITVAGAPSGRLRAEYQTGENGTAGRVLVYNQGFDGEAEITFRPVVQEGSSV